MRPLLLSSFALLFVACTEAQPRPPPTDRFIYPSGLQYRSVSGSTRGILYVASANFDRCFDQGTLMAVDLDQVGDETQRLPLLGASVDASMPPVTLEQLNVPDESRVLIQSYAGQMAYWERPDAAPRLFLTARADGDFVHYIDVPEPTHLSCVGSSSNNCVEGAVSLTTLPGQQSDLPRAPAPFGISVDRSAASLGDLWVTHLDPADSPLRSNTNFASYLVHLSGATPGVSTDNFVSLAIPNLPTGPSNSVVVDDRYVIVSGRFDARMTASTDPRRFLLRVLDKTQTSRIIDPGLDLSFTANEARGIALTRQLSSDSPRRLYVAVRSPDTLLIMNAGGLDTDSPSLNAVGSIPLPNGPTEVALIPRTTGGTTRSDLVLVSCSTAGVLAIYDPDVGQVVSQVTLGITQGTHSPQPFGIAVQHEEGSDMARVFVSNFGDGRISVVDIPDLNSPQTAQLVAYLGARQDEGAAATCQEEQQ